MVLVFCCCCSLFVVVLLLCCRFVCACCCDGGLLWCGLFCSGVVLSCLGIAIDGDVLLVWFPCGMYEL